MVVGVSGGVAGAGKVGVGAAADTTVLVKTVKAFIADDADGANVATVKAAKSVNVEATSTEASFPARSASVAAARSASVARSASSWTRTMSGAHRQGGQR